MGQDKSGISKSQMKDLQGTTKNKLTNEDIKNYHKFWFELFPDGEMTKDGFKKFASLAMPEAPQDADIDYLFRAMDQNKDGTITFKEFLIFQSITAPSRKSFDPEELINMAFNMYDEDGDGYVTEDEMRDSLTNMFKAKNLDIQDPSIKKTINQRIENLLSVADENGDGQLTKEEILKACKKDPSLLVMF
eukprot:gene7001-11166_t